MKKVLTLLLIVIFATPPQAAHAWAECGHHLIALMAFDLLTADEQAKIVALLQKHPRYAEDFSPPEVVKGDQEQQRWRIGRTGYWSDVIRKNPTYDRPTWHYEIGPAFVIGDPATLKVPARPGKLPSDATMETAALHISQAIELSKRTLADKDKSDAERAVAICWIAHLTGDAHQPCHAGSLFMEKVFTDEEGDRGANRIPTKQGNSMNPQWNNLHAVWDQLLGNEFSPDHVDKLLAKLKSNPELVTLAKNSLSLSNGLDPQIWLAESRAASAENVYAPEVIDSLRLVSRGLVEQPEMIDLTPSYLQNGERVAQRRAVQAAYRLAGTWSRALQ